MELLDLIKRFKQAMFNTGFFREDEARVKKYTIEVDNLLKEIVSLVKWNKRAGREPKSK